MRRLFVHSLPEAGGELTLDGGAARHARVLRLAVGEAIRLFDGRGGEADAELLSVDEAELRVRARPRESLAPPGSRVVLVQALPKGSKLEGIVRMCVEIGVVAIHLAESERSVPRLDAARVEKRIERLERVAREAARQSGRAFVPSLLVPAPLIEVAARAPKDAIRLSAAPGATTTIGDTTPLGADSLETSEAWVVIGPEGGLTPLELESLDEQGYRRVGLGDGVLRVETAAPVAVALLRSALTTRSAC